MKTMKLEDLQVHLDLQKWHRSQNEGMDMCRHMDYCHWCEWEDEFKCARAYLRMAETKEKRQKPKAQPSKNAKPAANKAKPAAKKGKPAAKKAKPAANKAPAKKAAAKKK